MDYSLLFIKVSLERENDNLYKVMPAIIFEKHENGTNKFKLKEVDEVENPRFS
jgi:hypothetical protein